MGAAEVLGPSLATSRQFVERVHLPRTALDAMAEHANRTVSADPALEADLERAAPTTATLVEMVASRLPPGTRGYVMKIDVFASAPSVYVKLQLGAGMIMSRNFHYSETGRTE